MFEFLADSVGREAANFNSAPNAVAMQGRTNDTDADVARVEAANAANRQQMETQWRQAMPPGSGSPIEPTGVFPGQYPSR
jgi:hypothetical protein